MSVTYISEPIKVRLWGKAAGRCEYDGCNKPLWRDDLTKAEFNTAYIAHIVADSPQGPRGDPIRSALLGAELSNLMLMCDEHHRLIDKGDVAGHPEDRLVAMKAKHEQRIENLCDIKEDKHSLVILYGANIGKQGSPLSFTDAAMAMVPDRYPLDHQPITISFGNSTFEDHTEDFWVFESKQICNVTAQLRTRIRSGGVNHLSLFALAPQPLLILLGAELSDIPFAEVYQRRKEPQSWTWEEAPSSFSYSVDEPPVISHGDAALVFSLSATVTHDRVSATIGSDIPIWRVSIPTPENDFVRSRAQTEAFRKAMRNVLDKIKAAHGEKAKVHVFPAMPASLAVDFGRVLNSKSDLPLIIYDQNKRLGGFIKALSINEN